MSFLPLRLLPSPVTCRPHHPAGKRDPAHLLLLFLSKRLVLLHQKEARGGEAERRFTTLSLMGREDPAVILVVGGITIDQTPSQKTKNHVKGSAVGMVIGFTPLVEVVLVVGIPPIVSLPPPRHSSAIRTIIAVTLPFRRAAPVESRLISLLSRAMVVVFLLPDLLHPLMGEERSTRNVRAMRNVRGVVVVIGVGVKLAEASVKVNIEKGVVGTIVIIIVVPIAHPPTPTPFPPFPLPR